MNMRLRVLVVDDNRDAADSLGLIVGACGHEVEVVYDGAAVLQKAPEFRPHVILLDIGLPHVDGYELARILRQQDALTGVMIIAVTGRGDDEQRKKALEAGFNFLLVKPIDPDMLTEALMMPAGSAGKTDFISSQ